MSKLLLVEDDNNLREIYEARLQAEGYNIVTAKDGEEALAVAKSEKPDLIISDVMMPKISGFEMLDILKNTDGLKNVKIIMLTALGQSDDQQRADKLGADRYLVKSQVTLEDIVRVTHELLEDEPAPATPEIASAPTEPTATTTTSPAEPVTPQPPVAVEPPITPAPEAVATVATPSDDQSVAVAAPDPVSTPAPEPTIAAPAPAAVPEPVTPVPEPDPVEPTTAPDADNKEAEPEVEPQVEAPAAVSPPASPSATSIPVFSHDEPATEATSASEEEANVESQIEDFVQGASDEATTPEEVATQTTTGSTAAPIGSTNASHDKLMEDAVNSLMGGEEPAAAPTVPEAVTPEPTPAETAPTDTPAAVPEPVTPVPEPDPVEPTTAPDADNKEAEPEVEETPAPSSSPTMSHNKVIAPLPSTVLEEKKPDIQALLAQEEAKEGGAGSIITPEASPSSAPAAEAPTDPNSIAL